MKERTAWERKNVALNLGDVYERCGLQAVCDRCRLHEVSSTVTAQRLQSLGAEQPTILIVQSHVTDAETGAGCLFGNDQVRSWIFHWLSKAMGIPSEEIVGMTRFASMVRCAGKTQKMPPKEHFKCCTDLLRTEIAYYKPRLVIGVGGQMGTDIYAAVGLRSRSRGHVLDVPRLLPMHSKAGESKKKVHLDRGEFPCQVFKVHDVAWALREPEVQEDIIHDLNKIPRILSGEYPNKDIFAGRNYHVVKDADFAIQICDYLAALDRFSFDIEAGPAPWGLDPYAEGSKILCVGFADVHRNAWCIPLEHKDCPYPERLPEVRAAIRKALESPAEKTAHNGPFDCCWFPLKYGYHVNNFHFDTQLAHGLVNENNTVPGAHKLKRLAELYTDLEHYDDALLDCMRNSKGKMPPDSKRCYEKHVSLEMLCLYCCADADAAEQLRLLFEDMLQQMGLLNYFYKMTMPDARSVITTHSFGVKFDDQYHVDVETKFGNNLMQARQVIESLPEHEKWKLAQSMEMKGAGKYFLHPSGWLYRGYKDFLAAPDKPLVFVEGKKVVQEAENGALDELRSLGVIAKTRNTLVAKNHYTEDKIKLNVGSPQQLVAFLFTKAFCNLHPVKVTDAGASSTDAEVLKKLKDHHPACQAILDVRTWDKAYSTYCIPYRQGFYEHKPVVGKKKEGYGYIMADGLLHPSYIMTGNDRNTREDKGKGTVTGRKSAVNPPIQTQKTRGEGAKEIKKMYVTRFSPGADLIQLPHTVAPATEDNIRRWGEFPRFQIPSDKQGGMVQLDFSQLELRLFAMIAGIAWMLQKYIGGADLHLELAMELFEKTAEECLANDKEMRGYAKEFWFGPIYGESAKGIQQQLAKKGYVISKEQAEALLDKMYDKMPEYESYRRACSDSLEEHAAVWTATGRRRYLPGWFSSEKYLRARALRQAGNFRIQSPGSDMTSWSWFTLNEWLELNQFIARIAISVHDSIVGDTPPGELPMFVTAAHYIMTHVPFRFLENAPVPILADAEAGRSWGQMREINKPLVIPEGVDPNAFYWSLPSDLWEFVGQGVAPMDVWQERHGDDPRLDSLKKLCATHDYL